MQNHLCEFLTWDSTFFRLRVGRLLAARLTPDILARADEWRRVECVDCLYFLAELDDPATLRLAEDGGFRLVDVRVTLKAACGGRAGGRRSSEGAEIVRRFRQEDAPALRSLARVSHRDSRFYFDGHFSKEDCDRMYQTWIEKSWEGSADAVFVADTGSGAVGYATAKRVSDVAANLGLLAVDTAAQGKGVGRRLAEAVVGWCDQEGLQTVDVVTQGRNRAALGLYTACGFQPSRLQLWYHRWFPAAPVEVIHDAK